MLYQVDDVVEPLALEGGVERGHEHRLAGVGQLLAEHHNIGELRTGRGTLVLVHAVSSRTRRTLFY